MVAVTVEQARPRLAIKGVGLVLLGIVLAALNLRPAVTSLGAVLEEVRVGLHLSGTLAGLITTLPVLCFAAFGFLTPMLARRFGAHPVLTVSIGMLSAGLFARAFVESTPIFFLASTLALAGIACVNILLPGLVKEYFPDRIGLITGVYSMTLTLGAALAAAVTVPAASALGGWHAGLAMWAVVAGVGLLPWLFLWGRATLAGPSSAAISSVRPAMTKIGWALATYCGTQSLNGYVIMGWLPQLYRDAGFSPQAAGLVVAAVMGLNIPIAFLIPTLAARRPDQRLLTLLLAVCCAGGYVGLLVAPAGGVLVWTLLLAIGQGGFPLGLAMIGLRSRTPEGTVALSAFAQSTGYLFAAVGPLLVGTLYVATGNWLLPLLVMLAAVSIQGISGMLVGRPGYLEDSRTRNV